MKLIAILTVAIILSGCANITTVKVTELDAGGKAVKTHVIQMISETRVDNPLPMPSLDRQGKAGQVATRETY